MQRYFVGSAEDGSLVFSEEQVRHIVRVMRMKPDDSIVCIEGGKPYLCRIRSIDPLFAEKVSALEEDRELPGSVTLLYCLPKGDKLDLVLQKATELGVDEIVLVQSERCVAKIRREDVERKIRRFQSIVREAAEQSRRLRIPRVESVVPFDRIGEYRFDVALIAYENETGTSLLSALEGMKKEASVGILIGSEGGFSPEEVVFAQNQGYRPVSLGKRILRSETATFYALSLIGSRMEGE